MGQLEITSWLPALMNTGEKVWRLAEDCRESTFHHTAAKICREVMFYLIVF